MDDACCVARGKDGTGVQEGRGGGPIINAVCMPVAYSRAAKPNSAKLANF